MADPNDTRLSDAVTKEFTAAGYKADHIATILARQESLKHERVRDQETWVTIHREHLLPETLDAYQLPWEWDEVSNYPFTNQTFASDTTFRRIPTTSSSSIGFRGTCRRSCLRILGVCGNKDWTGYKPISGITS